MGASVMSWRASVSQDSAVSTAQVSTQDDSNQLSSLTLSALRSSQRPGADAVSFSGF